MLLSGLSQAGTAWLWEAVLPSDPRDFFTTPLAKTT